IPGAHREGGGARRHSPERRDPAGARLRPAAHRLRGAPSQGETGSGPVRKVLLLALNDLRLTARARWSFLWMLVLPVARMWFFGQMGGPSKGPARFTLTIVDRDGGWVARAFVAALQTGSAEVREIAPAEEETAGKKVRALVLPAGFTAGVLAGEQ